MYSYSSTYKYYLLNSNFVARRALLLIPWYTKFRFSIQLSIAMSRSPILRGLPRDF